MKLDVAGHMLGFDADFLSLQPPHSEEIKECKDNSVTTMTA
jgi:hypothetical protein